MKQYFRNLWLAIIGCDPFSDEVKELRKMMEKDGDNMRKLRNQLYAALNEWDECQRKLEETKKALEEATATPAYKQLKSMQRLVENLRERIKEKDGKLEQQDRNFHERMELMKRDYQQRIKEYNDKSEGMAEK